MAVRWIGESEVERLADMPSALEAVELAFREQGMGTGINEPRRRVHQPNGILHTMAGALLERGYWGFKAYTTGRAGAQFTVNLYRVSDGALVAVLEANRLGQLRTGAASGVATKYLARPGSQILALFGVGYQSETQLAAIAEVLDLSEVRVFSRTESSKKAFCNAQERALGIRIQPVDRPEDALEGAEVITTITNAQDPVFPGARLQPGAHINAAGSNGILRAEVDRETVQKADLIFADDVEQARIECGDLIQAHARNALSWSRVRPFGDVVAGINPGRQAPGQITLFESQGIAIWDIALAAEIFERAEEANVGQLIEIGS